MEKEKKYVWPMSICLSSKCNRNCSHCAFDANMNGCFFTKEQAMLLAQTLKKETRISDNKELYPWLEFTGNGELLLNPDLVGIFDILFGLNPKSEGVLITSGIDPKSPEESERLVQILSRDYASRLKFDLSFNLFEKRFPKRLFRTLKLLFENGVREVGIKICQTQKRTLYTAGRLNDLIYYFFIKWIRQVDPLASWESMYNCDLEDGAERMAADLFTIAYAYKPMARESSRYLVDMRKLSIKELVDDMVYFRSNYCTSIGFPTKLGELKIKVMPHFLMKRGRAVSLDDPGFPPNEHKRLCNFLSGRDEFRLHVGADGCYYPDSGCPNVKSLRIGYLHKGFWSAYERFFILRKLLFRAIVADNRPYEDACQFCQNVSGELYYKLMGKSLKSECL